MSVCVCVCRLDWTSELVVRIHQTAIKVARWCEWRGGCVCTCACMSVRVYVSV